MRWSDIFPPADLLTRAEGVERGLRQYQHLGRLGWIAGVGMLAIQITLVVANLESWQKVKGIEWSWPPWTPLLELLGILPGPGEILLFFGIGLLIAAVWVRRRLQEARQPFRYTCSVGAFKAGEAMIEEKKLAWLSQDLMQRLSQRVGRLLFIDEKTAAEHKVASDDPHIHISGTYVIRQNRQERWLVEVMPRVRIGKWEAPDTLAYPIMFYRDSAPPKVDAPQGQPDGSPGKSTGPIDTLTPDDYERILERVYFSVATELYRQIQGDVQRKIDLLPTAYARAVALLHEAEDYARSNTLDGYENAADLYDQAAKLLDRRLAPRPHSIWRRMFFGLRGVGVTMRLGVRCGLARLWPSFGRAEFLCARAQIGYANMLLFRRPLAGISGRRLNPVFEARPVSERALARLHRLPNDVPGRNGTLFDAYVTCALVLTELGGTSQPRRILEQAQQLDPNRAEQDPHYLATLANCELHLMSRLELLRRALDLDPRFALNHFYLAYHTERRWRSRPNLEPAEAELVLASYDELIKLNPSLVAGWGNRGYVNWLLHNPEGPTGVDERRDYLHMAESDYENGREYKQIKRATAVSELNYGLARIKAETNQFPTAHAHYIEAIAELLAHRISHNAPDYTDYYFMLMNDDMMKRFERYKNTVAGHREALKNAAKQEVDPRVADTVYAFVLNDYGEACHNYFLRTGNNDLEAKAIEAFKEANRLNDDFVLPHFNLFRIEQADPHLEKVAELAPNWLDGRFARLRRNLKHARDARDEVSQKSAALKTPQAELQGKEQLWEQLKADEKSEMERRRRSDPSQSAQSSIIGASGKADQTGNSSAQSQHELVRTPTPAHLEREVLEQRDEIARLQTQIENKEALASVSWAGARELLSGLLPHHWLWKRMSPGGQTFDWSALRRRNLRAELRWERELTDLHALTLLEWGNALLAWVLKADLQQQRIRPSDVRALWRRCCTHLRRSRGDHRAASRWPIFSGLSSNQWRQRFSDMLNDIYLAGLMGWRALADTVSRYELARQRGGDALEAELKRQRIRPKDIQRLLRHLHAHFWPYEFELLGALRRNAQNIEERSRWNTALAEIVKERLEEEPNAYWALTWVQDTETLRMGRKWLRERYLSIKDMVEIYERTARTTDNPHVVLYVAEQLEMLALELKVDLDDAARRTDLERVAEGYLKKGLANLAEGRLELAERNLSRAIAEATHLAATHPRAIADATHLAATHRAFARLLKKQGNRAAVRWEKRLARQQEHNALLAGLRASEDTEGEADERNNTQPSETVLEAMWEFCLSAYKRARSLDHISENRARTGPLSYSWARSSDWYQGRIGRVLWALGRYQQALAAIEQITPQATGDSATTMAQVVHDICGDVGAPESYHLLEQWLAEREKQFMDDADGTRWKETRKASFELHRARHGSAEPRSVTDASLGRFARSWQLGTVPLVVEVHPSLLNGKADTPKDSPLFKDYFPLILRGIKRRYGLDIEEPWPQVDSTSLPQHAFVFRIHELRLSVAQTRPNARFCPRWLVIEKRLPRELRDRERAFNPLTGKRNGAWIEESFSAPVQRLGVELWSVPEYIARHLEFVICQHLATFVGYQEVVRLLTAFEGPERQEAQAVRQTLLGHTRASLQARAGFLRTLQSLVREHVPITDLGTMLITFGAMWTPGCDVTPIVETIRFTLKEMLPRNRKGTRLVMLPIAFEVAVGHWVRGPGDHRVFALPPQERNALLDNVRAHLDPDEEYRMVIVVRNHELRPYVALLVKQEFPLLTVLAERELCDDLRSYAGVLDPSPSGGQGGTTPDPVVAGGKVHYAC